MPESSTPSGPPPVAYGAHRFGRWGYISHDQSDTDGWIEVTNKGIPDPLARWHGPVPLVDKESVEDLEAEIDLKQACIKGMRDQNRAMAEELTFTQQWYAVRLARLADLVKTLPEETQLAYTQILANGSASPDEPPGYEIQLNLLRHELATAEQRADNCEQMLLRLMYATRNTVDSKVVAIREKAQALFRRLGVGNPLRQNHDEQTRA